MDAEYAQELLKILVENSARILRAGFGVDRAESAFFDVIALLREESSLKNGFLAMVERSLEERSPSGLHEGGVPRELLELAAHELRWPELRELAAARVHRFFGGNEALAISDVSRSVGEAYRDDWEDREFYQRYEA